MRYRYGFDLGSNTIRGILYDSQEDRFLCQYEKIVRTAEGLVESKIVSDSAIKRIIEAINEAKECYGAFEDLSIKAVTTEAIRRAENQDKVLEEIYRATGVRFETISGYEEAKFTMEAVRYRLKKLGIDSKSVLLIDIGGGSTEISIYNDSKFDAKTFPIGILTLTQEAKDLKSKEELLKRSLKEFREYISTLDSNILSKATFVTTAGTPTTISAILYGLDYFSYDANIINGSTVTLDDIDNVAKKLHSMSNEELTRAVGRGREDLIDTGILILKEIYRLVGRDRAIVIDDGLREGVAII